LEEKARRLGRFTLQHGTSALAGSFLYYKGVDLREALLDRHPGIGFGDAGAQVVEAVAHAANAGEEFGIDQCCDRFAVFADDDGVVARLDLAEQFD
jgi:hypothetical protein